MAVACSNRENGGIAAARPVSVPDLTLSREIILSPRECDASVYSGYMLENSGEDAIRIAFRVLEEAHERRKITTGRAISSRDMLKYLVEAQKCRSGTRCTQTIHEV